MDRILPTPQFLSHGSQGVAVRKNPMMSCSIMKLTYDQWEFQDAKNEGTVYHIRQYVEGISPYIDLT